MKYSQAADPGEESMTAKVETADNGGFIVTMCNHGEEYEEAKSVFKKWSEAIKFLTKHFGSGVKTTDREEE